MKVAISSTGKSLGDELDPRFGRAAGFILFDTDTGHSEHIDNTGNQQASKGAGIHAAQNVSRAGAEAVISGHIGPKAYAALESAKIQVYQSEVKSVQDVIEDFKRDRLNCLDNPDRPGHWEG